MVTVREKDCIGPRADHPGGHQGVPGTLGRRGEPVVLREPVAVESGGRRPAARSSEFSDWSRATSWRRSDRLRNHAGTAVNGRTSVRRRRLDRPERLAGRPRSGSTGESSPPARSRVTRVAQVRTRASRSACGRCSGPSGRVMPISAARRPAPAAAPRTPRRSGRRPAPPRSADARRRARACPVSWRSRSSSPASSAPPPVRTMPRSMMSPASSGGVWSRVTRAASMIACSGSSSASRSAGRGHGHGARQPGHQVATADLGLAVVGAAGTRSPGRS